ncbi:DUF2497 domain-containing protein [Sphingomonas sp. PB2P12]|uniref:DUF2497 domain-containing protein n=1 Tax=Sphingomonas sandaracina TaxID=3096157 RepID=UPI002FCA6099
MGDISAEPSMEEILSSIKRIIAEEGDTMPGRNRRSSRPTPSTVDRDAYLDSETDDDEILELSDPMPMVDRTPRTPKSPVLSSVDSPAEPRQPASKAQSVAQPVAAPSTGPSVAGPSTERPIVSRETAAATRAPLDALTRMMVKPDANSDGTLEGLVREMLRPMLREWMDANLPGLVEDMVAREIAKIMNQQP